MSNESAGGTPQMQSATNTPATSSLFTTSTFQKVPIVGNGAATSSTASADRAKEFRTGETLKAFTENLVDTFSKCFKDYKYSIASAPKRVLTKITELTHNSGFDNSDHDYICTVGGHIYNDGTSTNLCSWFSNKVPGETRTYEILDWLGQGTFGQVIKVQCLEDPSQMLALKIIKNKPAYFTQAHVEVRVLGILNRDQDPEDKYNIIRMKDSFVFRKHLCVVFELLSMNLYDVLRQNNFRGVTMSSIRQVSEQLLEALRCLRRARIIHCDLKPENVMISSLTPLRIKLIDFGSACSDAQTLYTYIQSRFYRSPEVLLGLPYTGAIDMWSLGCIAAELYLGLPIFPGTSEYDQVARIVRVLGIPPSRMLANGGKTKKYFKKDLVASPTKDSDENSEARLVQVEVMVGDLVDLIRFIMSDGQDKHYGKAGGKPAGEFNLGPDEWIVEVQQRLTDQSCLASITFKTNLGNSETFGGRTTGREQPPFKAAAGKQIIGLVRSEGFCQSLTSVVEADEPAVRGSNMASVSTSAPGSRSSTRDQRPGSDDTPLPSKEESPDEGEEEEDSGGGSHGQPHDGSKPSRRRQRGTGTGQTRYWRLKTIQEYQMDELKKVPPSRTYFNFTSLPSMIDCIPIRQKLAPEMLKFEQDRRMSFLQFLEGVLNLNPEERWTPKQALGHPLIASEKSPYDPNFAPTRDEEPRSHTPQLDSHDQAGGGGNHADWSSAPSAPSVSANSSAGSSASSPAASSSRGQGRERGHGFPRLRGGRSGRGDWSGLTSLKAKRRLMGEDFDMSLHSGGSVASSSTIGGDMPPAAAGPPMRGHPCGGASSAAGDSSPWHLPSPMSEQSTGASERMPSSNYSGTDSGGEVVSRASYSDASGSHRPRSAYHSDSDNAIDERSKETTHKDWSNIRPAAHSELNRHIPPTKEAMPSPSFRKAFPMSKSGPVVGRSTAAAAAAAASGIPQGQNSGAVAAGTAGSVGEEQGVGRFAPPARANSNDSGGRR